MEWIFLINLLIVLAIALRLGINFFRHHKDTKIHEIVKYLSFIGILYFSVAIFSFLWFLGILSYDSEDFLLLYSLVILIQSIFLFMIVYSISSNKKIFYFLLFYVIILLSFLSSAFDFFYLFLITSFLLTLSFFIDLSIKSGYCEKTGYLGIFYSSLSLLFCILLLFRIGNIFVFSLVSNFIFLILISVFLWELRDFFLVCKRKEKRRKKSSFFLVLLRYLVFLLIMTNFIFIGTVAIHEFGHLAVSRFYDCSGGEIVVGKDIHTEILCGKVPNNALITLGGFLLPFLIAVLLFVIGGKFIKDIALLIVGFDLISVDRDLLDLGFSGNIIMATLIVGVLCIIAGIAMLIRSRLEERIYA